MKTYIIKNKTNGLFKIGKSKNVVNRFDAIRKTSIDDFELVLIINHDCESLLHAHFSNQNVKWEWFLLTDSDLIDIFDFESGENRISFSVDFMGIKLQILTRNNFVQLNKLKAISILESDGCYIQSISNQSEFIKSLMPKFGVVTSRNNSGPIWCHIILFLEIARTINAKLKIEVYETLLGNKNTDVHQIV